MRLLNTESFKLQEFLNEFEIPSYAILSHRWEADEVSLQDFEAGSKKDSAGYAKIVGACEQARSLDFWQKGRVFDWIWIDTCCIDKTSSAELSEAINSMYKWYERSAVCMVFLSDITTFEDGKHLDEDKVLKLFRQSSWFTRGWTLQELIAPEAMVFWDRDWRRLGTKEDLLESIVSATGIPRDVLKPPYILESIFLATDIPGDVLMPQSNQYGRSWFPTTGARVGYRRYSAAARIRRYSVAQKLSWAARRETTRVEDVAYCLLGIFQVNMPLLYGEGQAAFRRLQLEILRTSEDESILAWAYEKYTSANLSAQGWLRSTCPLLARNPGDFAGCQDVQTHTFVKRKPFSIVNRGLYFEALCTHRLRDKRIKGIGQRSGAHGYMVFPLNCTSDPDRKIPLMLELRDNVGAESTDIWSRTRCIFAPTVAKRLLFWPFLERKWIYIRA